MKWKRRRTTCTQNRRARGVPIPGFLPETHTLFGFGGAVGVKGQHSDPSPPIPPPPPRFKKRQRALLEACSNFHRGVPRLGGPRSWGWGWGGVVGGMLIALQPGPATGACAVCGPGSVGVSQAYCFGGAGRVRSAKARTASASAPERGASLSDSHPAAG